LQLSPDAASWRALLHTLRAVRSLFARGQLAQQSLELIHHGRRNQPTDDARRQSFPHIAFAATVAAFASLFLLGAHHILLILM
jgi:hypothetical protein